MRHATENCLHIIIHNCIILQTYKLKNTYQLTNVVNGVVTHIDGTDFILFYFIIFYSTAV